MFVDTKIRIFDTTGSTGAVRAVAMEAGAFNALDNILTEKDIATTYIPDLKNMDQYRESYGQWKNKLEQVIGGS